MIGLRLFKLQNKQNGEGVWRNGLFLKLDYYKQSYDFEREDNKFKEGKL